MNPYFTLPALVLLAACATPQEQCINTAAEPARALQQKITELEGNITRGYAIHKQRQTYTLATICYDKDKIPYSCLADDYRWVETPVTINIPEQRRQLAILKRRLPAEQRKARQAIAACRATYRQ